MNGCHIFTCIQQVVVVRYCDWISSVPRLIFSITAVVHLTVSQLILVIQFFKLYLFLPTACLSVCLLAWKHAMLYLTLASLGAIFVDQAKNKKYLAISHLKCELQYLILISCLYCRTHAQTQNHTQFYSLKCYFTKYHHGCGNLQLPKTKSQLC